MLMKWAITVFQMGRACCIHGEMKNVHGTLVGKPAERDHLKDMGMEWENNITR
jgi:hypothetical protein